MRAVRVTAFLAALAMPLGMSATASAGLLSNLTTSVSKVTSAVTIPAGTAQLTTGVQGLLTGATTSLTTAQATVAGFQATVQPSIATAITNLQTRAQATAAHAAALDTAGTTADVAGTVSDLQGAATSEIAALTGVALTQGLTNGLTIAQQVISPVCSILGTPAALAQGVGVDLTRFYPLASGIAPLDQTANNLLTSTYGSLYDAILGSVSGQLGPAGAAAGAVLSLLKYNWSTTYYPPNGGTPVVRTTKALLDVPTPIDVDGSGSYDLCATTTLALDAGTGSIKLSQQISKLPLAKAVLPVDISGALLGVIGFGYETKDSTAPTNFTSDISVGSNPLLRLDNTYTVFRGTTLTLPPLLSGPYALPLNGPPVTIAGITLPTITPLTSPAPTPKITQVMSIGGSALALRFRHENEPNATHTALSLTPALNVDYQGSAPSDLFSFETAIGTIGLGLKATPAGTSFNGCVSGLLGANGSCSAAPDTTGNIASLRFASDQPTTFDLFQTLVAPSGTAPCPTLPLMDAHLTGRGLTLGTTPGTTAASSGKLWVDTGDAPVSGCIAVGNATKGVLATLPDGFKAKQRQSAFHTTQVFGFTTGSVPDAKSGTITCPAGTTLVAPTELIVTTFPLTPSVCSLPPANTAAPSIAGQALVDATLTATPGTWTPGAPNAPQFSYQWNRCSAAGTACVPIGGATAATYFLAYGDGVSGSASSDLGHTFTVTVTGTNLDGAAIASAPPTAVVALPPAPVNTAKPVVGNVTPPGPPTGVGRQLKTTNGTWSNGVLSFAYTWLRCDEDGASCAPIGAPSASTYTPVAADKGHVISVTVTATNHGGNVAATAVAGLFVPPAPVSLTAASVFNGASDATAQTVLTGDSLTAHDGTWKYATAFDYDWQRCDAAGNDCASIGAHLSAYTATSSDIGHTLRVAVTASNIDGETDSLSAATGVVELNDLEIKPPTAVVDGTVAAVAPSDHGTTYLGGTFDTAGSPTGGAGAVPAGLAALPVNPDGTHPVAGAARTQGGTVRVVAADGAGGYYLGGSFTKVQGQPCVGLAHVVAAGTLDPTYCQPGLTGEVRAVDVANGLVAIGGSFTLGTHANLAFIKGDGSALYAAEGDPDGAVNAIADDSAIAGTSFYAGGDFRAIGVGAAKSLAKFTVAAGPVVARSAWSAGVERCVGTAIGSATPCATSTASVRALAFVQPKLLGAGLPGIVAGGSFDRTLIGTTYTGRNNAAVFNVSSAATLGGWNPNADGAVNTIGVPVPVLANNAAGAIYLGGDFTKFGATTVGHLGQFGISALGGGNSSGTGATSSPTTNFTPAIPASASVNAIAFDATNNVYVGGSFTTVGAAVRHRLAAFKPAGSGAVSAAEAWDPNAGRTVTALARTGGSIVAGGAFTVLGGVSRSNLAEITPGSGLTAWNPGADGPVRALTPATGGVYVGGVFGQVAGVARANVAAVDNAGAATGWAPGTDGPVDALATDATGVYVGGAFAAAGGQPHANLAKVDGSGTALAAWTPDPDGPVHALLVRAGALFAGGAFANAGAATHASLVRLDAATGAATTWAADVTGAGADVKALAASGDIVYVGGSFDAVAGEPRANAAAVDADSGTPTAFAPDADGTVRTLLPRGAAVFLGGDFHHVGGATRSFAGQVPNGGGAATTFAPEPDAPVRALGVTGGGALVLGGDFASVAGTLAPGAAFFGGS
jgi:hypothetical protein